MAKRGTQFQTIRTEGAILPPDILRRIASLKVDGATPDAYHLPPGSKLNEAISQSWTSLLNHWHAFQDARAKLPESELSGTSVTNERWLLPLFKELDYGRLVTTKSPEIDERVYPIERFYNHTPIHLIGCKLPLDRRTSGARGAATASPHSMVQEFVNRSGDHLWAFLSNGLQLRILRDNISLSRQAFVEFDLEAMMEGEVYADFALLWLLCHQSRVEADKPVECWLEKWSHLAREQGTRVLNDLRVGVKKAIEALGRGFIGHPRNDHLREKLRTGSLSTEEFYRQLLRTVYRLLFLFVAEDRELIHPPNASLEACNLYDTHYSTRRLRELARKIRGSKHADLWHSLSLVFDAFSRNNGCTELGLSGLGSFLWRSSSTADLIGPAQSSDEAALITNDDLLEAVRALAYVEQDRVLRGVDYRNLGSEELGSVYESLLELHPVMNVEAKAFELSTAAGNERKTSGSYYTPDSLVQCLLDSALEPVIQDRLKGKKVEDAVAALLGTKVCDPACGSGHFLIAAAHRMARHLARIRTGDAEPTPVDYQHALRDVIGRCVYGVDLNPMAVELCKVSLWMEAIEPGKPLSFLDHHIQCGNSLLGTTPALLAKGIPDGAFKAIEGDVKKRVIALKKDNKRQRQDYESGQGYLFAPMLKLGKLPETISQINVASEASVDDVAAKQVMYEKLVKGADYLNARLLADTWCAAFVWKKDDSDLGKLCPTDRDFRSIEVNPEKINIHVNAEVQRLSRQYHFFHWHLAFPDVFDLPDTDKLAENEQTAWDGGFDVILGNPPWETLELSEKEFFTTTMPEISESANRSKRKALIAALEESEPGFYSTYLNAQRQMLGTRALIQESGVFPFTSYGRINTSSLFAESATFTTSRHGCSGIIVPSGIATDVYNKKFFDNLMEKRSLHSLYDFENRKGLFPEIDSRIKFCLLTTSSKPVERSRFVFFATDIDDIKTPERLILLSREDIRLLNPNTRTCPIFRDIRDAELCRHFHSRLPIIHDEETDANPMGLQFWTTFYIKDASAFFEFGNEIEVKDGYVPVFEGKMAHQFDHRFADFEIVTKNGKAGYETFEKGLEAKCNPNRFAIPRYFVDETRFTNALSDKPTTNWFLGTRDVTNATNERTAFAFIYPRHASFDTIRNMSPQEGQAIAACLTLANINSFAFDYCTRQRLGGMHFTFSYSKQVPICPPSIIEKTLFGVEFFICRVLELTYSAWDLEAFALDCGYAGPPFRWDEKRRFQLRCELDAAYFHLYLGMPSVWGTDNPKLAEMFLTPRDAVDYIMEAFPIVKRKDVARTAVENGEGCHYASKDAILTIYDQMADAIRTGNSYLSPLDPPPGPPRNSDGSFAQMADWDVARWPPHICQSHRESKLTS